MTPEQFIHIRKHILRMKQIELAPLLNKTAQTIRNYEKARVEIPSGVAYAMAWFATFGTADPWGPGWAPHLGKQQAPASDHAQA
jgi:hypothetical protein